MPKAKIGVLIKTDVATKIYLQGLIEKEKFILMDIGDDRHLFINEKYLDFVKEKVQEFKDKHSWEKPANAPEKFAEL